jgi:hypothetical protein
MRFLRFILGNSEKIYIQCDNKIVKNQKKNAEKIDHPILKMT